jgi:hypothetical protein
VRLALFSVALLLVAGGVAGCDDGGGGGGGAGSASTKEFCGALKDFQDDFSGTDPTKDLQAYVKTLKQAAGKLEGVGTPKDMPTDAKDGFDLTVSKIKDLSDTATLDDLANIGDVSDEDQKKLDALDEYISKTCPDLGGETDSSSSPSSPSAG